MNPVFEIIPEAIFFQQTNLICEISPDGFSYVFENDIDKKFHGLSVFYFSKDANASEELQLIFSEQPLLKKNYKKVLIAYTGIASALIPEELYQADKNEVLLDTVFGDLNESLTATDFITDKKIYNVYRMPADIHKTLLDQFPLAEFAHHYSLIIKQDFANISHIKIIFYQHTFIATLIVAGELQIINTYSYQSATDVFYHLLNILKQFDIDKMNLVVSGMIEINSELHKEIAHYFPTIIFEGLPSEYEFTAGLKELPAHYFSHLFSFATCV